MTNQDDHDLLVKMNTTMNMMTRDLAEMKNNVKETRTTMITTDTASFLITDAFSKHRAEWHAGVSWQTIGKILAALVATGGAAAASLIL